MSEDNLSGYYVEFVPSLCKGSKAKYTGSITYLPPSYEDKLENLEKLEGIIDIDSSGQIKDEASMFDNIKVMRRLISIAKNYIVKIDIRSKKGNKKHESYESLSRDPEASGIITEFAYATVMDGGPSKNSKA